jgi:DNA polymerase-1
LHASIAERLRHAQLDVVYREQEAPLQAVLAAMESYGVRVDLELCQRGRAVLRTRIDRLEALAEEIAGRPVLLSSPQAVSEWLFIDLKLQHDWCLALPPSPRMHVSCAPA